MRDRFLPPRADNGYVGQRLALVLLALLLIVRTGIALGSIFNGHAAASSADGIPLDSYGADGARTVLSLFALLGLANLVVSAVGILVLLRYRTLVPFVFALLLVQQLGRSLVLELLPIARVGAPPGTLVNRTLLGAMVLGLALSLWRRDRGVSATP